MTNSALKTPLSSFFISQEGLENGAITSLHLIEEEQYQDWFSVQPRVMQNWLSTTKFEPQKGNYIAIPNKEGLSQEGLVIIGSKDNLYSLSSIPAQGGQIYKIKNNSLQEDRLFQLCLGWALGCYNFTPYKTKQAQQTFPKLIVPDSLNIDRLKALADGIYLTRDLINTPPNDMMPQDLEDVTRELAETYKAEYRVVLDHELIEQDYHAIYAVGKASVHRPRLLDLTWGKTQHPQVTLVGKGVCFDSGGLDIKPGSNMILMKKDMGGAAHVLGLASIIMKLNLPIRLRVLIGAVENAIGGESYRPSDVIQTKKGTTIEITNTDAEGRLVLADCLTEACAENPDLIIDFATLTGAARTALGPDLPPAFSNDDLLVHDLIECGNIHEDPLWHLPLWKDYNSYLESKIADMVNAANTGFAGAITAGLFLQHFVPDNIPWIHIDCYGWNPTSRAGRSHGGATQGIRAVLSLIEEKFNL